MGNGYPISALVGKKEIMKKSNEIFYSLTFGSEPISMAAAIATIKFIKKNNVLKKIDNNGSFFIKKLNELIERYNLNGYINIVGRAKEMIIRGGENLYPIEIENYLLEHPGVLEVAVFGLPDKKYDEECCAVTRVDADILTDPDELRDWCKNRISRWKIPRYIFFVESFPITPSGKIQKYKLQEKYITDLKLD